MAWKSTTFKKSDRGGQTAVREAVSRVLAKHQTAMSAVVSDAKELADERRRRLDSIKDPQLQRSAAR